MKIALESPFRFEMVPKRTPAAFEWLRSRIRANEVSFVFLAVAVGMVAGFSTVIVGALARTLQHHLYGLGADVRLSGVRALSARELAILPLGGVMLALFTWVVRARGRALIDAVEANALHGGRMTVRDSAIIAGQTIISNGFGASVGLEAAYAQMGALFGSLFGKRLKIRRADLRILVGAGAGGSIAAAFGAPIAGTFYAFEVIIGAYTPAAIAPVAAAALAGAQVAQRLGIVPYIVRVQPGPSIHTFGYLIYAGLGLVCALIAIAVMRAVAITEAVTRATLPWWSRQAIGGALLIPIATQFPQILSAGHSALHLDMMDAVPIAFILSILAAKSLASIISLGFGFRGGLFFASLFLGTLVGHIYAAALAGVAGHSILNVGNAAMVGMAALAVAVVGGPFTMSMLVLEATGNFSLTGAVLAASLVSSTVVRQLFGYSFSTWRLHLRGEAIKSVRDVGWIRSMTAGQMMAHQFSAAPAATSIADFRRMFPLGSTSLVVLVDERGRYAGLVAPHAAFADGVDERMAIATIEQSVDRWLSADLNIREIMSVFDDAQADELAVVDAAGHPIGVLSEKYVRRRYAEELDKAQSELFGEG